MGLGVGVAAVACEGPAAVVITQLVLPVPLEAPSLEFAREQP